MKSPGTRETFFTNKKVRNKRCREKDSIIVPILKKIPIENATNFKALLMPCLHGPEVETLLKRGVPIQNLYSIERKPSNHSKMKIKFIGMHFTEKPESFERAVDEFDGVKFDLVYLDFLARPYVQHAKGFWKMTKLEMFASKSMIILNFGTSRCVENNAILNSGLATESEAEAYMKCALHDSHYKSRLINSKIYASKSPKATSPLYYQTTVMEISHV